MGKRKSIPAKDKTVDNMRRFHAALDFSELWEDFYLSVSPNGMSKHRSTRDFIKNHQHWNPEQKKFMTWLLGPLEPIYVNMTEQYPEFAPMEWDAKRESGGWHSEQSLRAYGKSVRDKIDALEALRAAGNNITLNSVARVEQLMQQLDKDMGGRLFIPELDVAANTQRATLYIRLHERLLLMLDKAQDIYAKSHGINYNDMSGFERLLAAQMLTQKTEKTQDKGRLVLEKILDMTLEKSVKYDTPMPDGVRETALTVLRKKTEKPVN